MIFIEQPPAIIAPAKDLLRPSRRQLWRPSAPAIIIGFGTAAAAGGGGGGGGGSNVNSETDTWAARVVTNGGAAPSTTSQGKVDALITAVKANATLAPAGGLANVLDRLWLLANFDNNNVASLTSIINPATGLATENHSGGAWASQTLGWQGDGAHCFIDTGYNTNSSGQWAQNSACYGVYSLTDRASSDSKIVMGNFTGSVVNQMLMKPVSAAVNGINGGALSTTAANRADGLQVMIRTGSAANQAQFVTYNSGGSGLSVDGSNVSGSVNSANMYIFARNNSGADSFEDVKLGCAFIGKSSGTSAALAAALSSVLNAYMSSLGINVY